MINYESLSEGKTVPLKIICNCCLSYLEVDKSDIMRSIFNRDGNAIIINCQVCKTTIYIDSSLWRIEGIMEISFEDFTKIDIRSGTIIKAERVPKSSKLLRLEVGFGQLGSRVILAGIGKDFEPDALIGVSALFVVNLAPRQMMGMESHGMILAASNSEGKVVLSSCAGAPDGTQVG